MSKPKILIVGCGAVGLVQGYHLSAGAAITYLVRPGRSPAFAPPKRLYDYKANALRTFGDYRVIESPSEVAGEDFYCVFDTLDGYTARSDSGASTLRAVGDLIRDKKNTFVVYDSIGLDMDKYYADTMGISKDRLVLAMSMLAHQPTTSIPIPETADRELVAQADILYSHQEGKIGLLMFNIHPRLSKALQEVYKKNGTLSIKLLPSFIMGWAPFLAILHLVTWKIDGYQEFAHFENNKELWSLMLKAQSEILTLPRFGWGGWILSFILGSWATSKMNKAPIEGALPLSYQAFNAFHHGDKVVKQDVGLLKDIVAEGDKVGHKMKALNEICHRVEELLKKST